MRVLEIGPSPYKAKGGMSTVIKGITEDSELNSKFDIDIHESYIDGHFIKRLGYSIYAFLIFFLKYRKYDIFHVHAASYGSTFRKGYYIRFLSKRGKKIILHIHGAEYLIFYDALSVKKKRIVQDIWIKTDTVVALSEQWKKKFEVIFNHPNIVVISNGIDTKQLEQGQCKVIQYRNSFLLLGRLCKRKGVYDIIQAVKDVKNIYPDIKIYMAGDGEVGQVKRKVFEEGVNDNIDVIGWVNFDEKIELLKRTATVVLPSYNEGLPMAILEGMAAGKVIICTNVGGIPDVVTNGKNGIIIEPGDISGLKKAIIRVMSDKEFDNQCFRENIKKINSYYSRKYMHDKLAVVFRETVKI